MFHFIKEKFYKIYNQCTTQLVSIFGKSTIDENALQELEKVLIEADTGITLTRSFVNQLRQKIKESNHPLTGQEVKTLLGTYLQTILATFSYQEPADIILLVGINGSGKTTSVGKLAFQRTQQGKRVMLAAADTFRAAAVDQLARWAEQIPVPLFKGTEGQDPASVVFAACQAFKEKNYDLLIIDTAGRLQTKTNLMKELEKIKRVITQQLPTKKVVTLLVIDALLGQNSFEQAKLFHESTPLDGIILTKMDSTAKGGIVFAITQELKIPIAYLSSGENIENLYLFDAQTYINKLLDA
jgi:fused signal recognition particle receptor